MIGELIGDWIKGILIDGIMGNLSGLFSTVNTKVGEIASDVGTTPQAWNSGIFNMLQSLSDTVIVPIAAAILAVIMCYELIDMIVEKNNMHDFDTSMFFRWIFKSAFAILIVTNTWNIVMGVFDATQAVVNQSAGVIIGETSIDFDTLIPDLEAQLEAMDIGPLLGLWFQTLVVGLTMNILSICIFLVTYGRMIEIYAVTALGPIPLATLGNAEWRGVGQNYLKSLLALGFQAFLIMVVVGIYAVLIQQIGQAADISGAIWGCMGYTVLLDDENVYRKMQGHWIIEMSEMIATANAKSIEEIKSFLSRQKETYKIPYETHPADRKRQCVFGGSSNTLDFLPLDRTGNRRFVPVMVYPERAEVHILADEQASREYINQMWAEAMEIYRSGNFRLRFSPAMNAYLKAHQKDFMPEDTKAGQILDYLERYSGSIVCSKQLYKEALGHDYDEPKQWELREINDIMNNAVTGWRAFSNPRYFPEPYRRQKGWERIRNDNEPDNSMDGFQEIPTEEMEQLGLPEEWLKQK